MLPFPVDLKPGLPITEQVVQAVKKAVLTGRLLPGERFPSVRQLSQALRVNPNTARKIVGQLQQEGILISTPAVGTTVAEAITGTRAEKASVLGPDLERVVIEARKTGIKLSEVEAALRKHWQRLGGEFDPTPTDTPAAKAARP
ncbi:GntR family transcriptional regulator [Actomonas aquatica]|uniref:GntR family transcriptional regulator n=1 Tax=Actomonas aquatica TaxID=2866162 RepID=A0ABZ1C4I7_9BACT|nr:GntR family transcriptional regulator [Opitutus sp. WL0086]WRQ86272.1 GntR family transcriptional regulator [Opitutus sp. WL0086]